MKRIWMLMLTFAMILCMSLTAMAEQGQEAKEEAAALTAVVATKSSPLSLRETPSQGGTVICEIPKGATVTVLEKGDWPKVEYDGKTGFVNGKYLKYNKVLSADAQDIVGEWVATDNKFTTIQLNADGTGALFLGSANSNVVGVLEFRWTLDGQDLIVSVVSSENTIVRFIGDYDGETFFISFGGTGNLFIRQNP